MRIDFLAWLAYQKRMWLRLHVLFAAAFMLMAPAAMAADTALLDVTLPSAEKAQPQTADKKPQTADKKKPESKSSMDKNAAGAKAEDTRPYGLPPLPEVKPVENKNYDRELARVEAYLNRLTSIQSDFTQVAPDGSLASGTFYLQRPGKMRWDYKPPTPVLMIMNGFRFIFYDKELEQVTHLPVDSNLAGLLTKKNISLRDPGLVIEELVTSPGAVRLKLHQKNKREEGALLLELSDQPLKIRNIVVTDASGQTTTVSLSNARFGLPLAASLFEWKDPRKRRK